MSQSPPVVEQPLGHAVDRDVGVERVAVGRGLVAVGDAGEARAEDATDEFDWPLGCTGLSSSTCGRCTGGSSTSVLRATNAGSGGVDSTSSPPRLALLLSRRLRARSARAAAVLGLSSGFVT